MILHNYLQLSYQNNLAKNTDNKLMPKNKILVKYTNNMIQYLTYWDPNKQIEITQQSLINEKTILL